MSDEIDWVTGVRLLPASLAARLGMWSARTQRLCPHPEHRERLIGGDERMYGFLRQCMECGLLRKDRRDGTT